MDTDKLIQEFIKLPLAERYDVLGDIMTSIVEDEANETISEELKEELQQRLEDYRNGIDKGETWDVVKARILASRESVDENA